MNRTLLLAQLDAAVEDARDSFGGTLAQKITRLARKPLKTILRKTLVGVLKQRYRVTLRTTLFTGKPLWVDNNDQDLWYSGMTASDPEIRLAKYLIRELKHSHTFFDVGANYGLFSALACDMSIETHAFEPSATLFAILRKNARLRRGLHPVRAAAYSRDGVVTFYDSATAVSTTDASFAREHEATAAFRKTEVPAVTLDRYCEDTGAVPGIIKIDVEGAEREVLLGARGIIGRYRPIVILEIISAQPKHRAASELLMTWGYTPHRIENGGTLVLNASLSLPEDTHENLVFLPPRA